MSAITPKSSGPERGKRLRLRSFSIASREAIICGLGAGKLYELISVMMDDENPALKIGLMEEEALLLTDDELIVTGTLLELLMATIGADERLEERGALDDELLESEELFFELATDDRLDERTAAREELLLTRGADDDKAAEDESGGGKL